MLQRVVDFISRAATAIPVPPASRPVDRIEPASRIAPRPRDDRYLQPAEDEPSTFAGAVCHLREAGTQDVMWVTRKNTAGSGLAQMAHRSFQDSVGRQWQAWSVVPGDVDSGFTPAAAGDASGHPPRHFQMRLTGQWLQGWLAFETDGEKRRLAPIPDAWELMTPTELEALILRATLVRRTAPRIE